jgi:hypothetical protein
VVVPKFQIGDIVMNHFMEFGVVEKVEEHIIIKYNEAVFVYYVRMFKDYSTSSIYFYEEVLTKVSE